MKGGIKLGIVILFVLAVAAGCGPTNVQQENMAVAQLNRPSSIYFFVVAVDTGRYSTQCEFVG